MRYALAIPSLLAGALACSSAVPPPPTLQFSPVTLPKAQVGQPYQATITVLGNLTPVFSLGVSGALPDGLTFQYHPDDSFGTIVGTPRTTGVFQFKIAAVCLGTNVSGQAGEQSYSLEVAGPLAAS